jgi:carboxypeptidase family protein
MNRRVSVPKPCTANWETMAGGEQIRHCCACARKVYNFSEMTSAQVERALNQPADRVCARIIQNADGTILTRSLGRNLRWNFAASVPRIAGAALSALLASGMAKPSTATPAHPSQLVQIAGAQEEKVALTVRVDDESGAVIANAKVTIVNKATGARIDSPTNNDGVLKLNDLARGTYEVTVASAGFTKFSVGSVEVPSSGPLNVRLSIGRGGPTVLVGEVVEVPAELTHSPTSEKLVEPSATPIPQHQGGPIRKFFRKLGHIFS